MSVWGVRFCALLNKPMTIERLGERLGFFALPPSPPSVLCPLAVGFGSVSAVGIASAFGALTNAFHMAARAAAVGFKLCSFDDADATHVMLWEISPSLRRRAPCGVYEIIVPTFLIEAGQGLQTGLGSDSANELQNLQIKTQVIHTRRLHQATLSVDDLS